MTTSSSSPTARGPRRCRSRSPPPVAASAPSRRSCALLDVTEQRQRAWTDGWARPALGEVAPAERPAFLRQGKTLFDAYRQAEAAAESDGDRLRERVARRQVLLLVLAALLEIVILVAVATVLRRRFAALRADVVEPVEGLVATIDRIRGGDLSARAEPRGPAELQSIGSGLDAMASALEDARDAADAKQRELERPAPRPRPPRPPSRRSSRR